MTLFHLGSTCETYEEPLPDPARGWPAGHVERRGIVSDLPQVVTKATGSWRAGPSDQVPALGGDICEGGPTADGPHFTKMIDLTILAMPGGRDAARPGGALLADGSFTLTASSPGSGVMSVIEATLN